MMGNGLFLIVKERNRQQAASPNGEGWTEEHDDKWTHGQLALAAMGYIIAAVLQVNNDGKYIKNPPGTWPWAAEWWKPQDCIRNLVKAGALIAAEIDRLERLEEGKADHDTEIQKAM